MSTLILIAVAVYAVIAIAVFSVCKAAANGSRILKDYRNK